MLKINAIASSSQGNLYTLGNGNTKLIVELGVAWRQVLLAVNFDLSRVAGALVTHEHKDHSRSVMDAAKAGLDIYLSEGTAEAIGATGHRIHGVASHQLFKVGDWNVLPFDVEHDAADPLGFVIMSGHERVLVITDTAYCRYKFSRITRLMIECNFADDILEKNMSAGLVERSRYERLKQSHMSLERVKDFLAVQDTSLLKEVHLMHLSDSNSDADLFKIEIQKITGTPVYIC